MVQFITQKLLHKKWMNFCLFIGFFILVSTAACNPMYQRSALERMLQSDFTLEEAEQGAYPGTIQVSFFQQSAAKDELDSTVFKDASKVEEKLEQLFPEETLYKTRSISMSAADVVSSLARDDEKGTRRLTCSCMSDLDEHVNLIKGTMYSETDVDGVFDAIVSRSFLEENGVIFGDEMTFATLARASGGSVKVRIAGVFEAKDNTDPYWAISPNTYTTNIFISEEAFDSLMADENIGQTSVYQNYYYSLDVSKLRITDVDSMQRGIKALKNENGEDSIVTATVNMTPVIEKYQKNETKVITTMTILQMPVFVLLVAFIYMVSKQMLEMEKGEIAMMKSRGASRFQILLSYVGQSAFLAILALLTGIPGGYLLCKVLGSADAFLEFVDRDNMFISINATSILFAIAAALIAMAFMTLPVIKHSKVGIVEQKQQRGNNEPPVWRKFYLDILLFLLACYAYYNFSNQRTVLIKKVAEGEGLDPLLYISSSLFILGAGFLALRIVPLCIKLIFKIGQKHWNCALYSSFLQILRTSNRQLFISVFLILTVATGIFGANTARSINQNQEDRLKYDSGADIILEETWKSNYAEALHAKSLGTIMDVVYEEPDMQKYDSLEQVESIAKVIRDDAASFTLGGTQYNVSLLGINTKEFGETAWMKDGVLDKHWYNYLNDLAESKNGALVSSNLKKDLNVNIGDSIVISRINAIDNELGSMEVVICGFIDAFPGYVKEDGTYFFVTNYSNVVNSYGLTPYELWIKSTSDSNDYIYDFIQEENIRPAKFEDTKNNIVRAKNEPVFQITNGLLTLSFVVILILCMIGFLIYWILSIRQRELLFGIYRAMGMSMKEIYNMLINEHIFSSIVSIAVGVVVGIISSKMFIPLILLTYMPQDHNLPIAIVSKTSDMVRLGVAIGIMLVTCLIVIGTILKKMKITQVLKLGEE